MQEGNSAWTLDNAFLLWFLKVFLEPDEEFVAGLLLH